MYNNKRESQTDQGKSLPLSNLELHAPAVKHFTSIIENQWEQSGVKLRGTCRLEQESYVSTRVALLEHAIWLADDCHQRAVALGIDDLPEILPVLRAELIKRHAKLLDSVMEDCR